MSFLSGFPAVLKMALPLAAGAALAGAIAWGASGGGGGGGAPEAPAAAAPTPKPEKTPGPPWDPARLDCPPGWQVYNDPDSYFSLCHPPGLREITGAPPSGVASAFIVTDPENVNARTPVNVFALEVSRLEITAQQLGPVASPSVCSTFTGGISKPSTVEYVQMSVGGRAFTGCRASGEIGRGPQILLNHLRLMAPAASDGSDRNGFINITVTSIGPDMQGTFNRASAVLDTIRFR